MDTIRTGMPLLARHEGEWVGEYIHVDANNVELDRHASHLQCKFQDDATYPYYQINTYTWPDGRTEVRDFPASYRDGRIWWDNDLIKGWAAAAKAAVTFAALYTIPAKRHALPASVRLEPSY